MFLLSIHPFLYSYIMAGPKYTYEKIIIAGSNQSVILLSDFETPEG